MNTALIASNALLLSLFAFGGALAFGAVSLPFQCAICGLPVPLVGGQVSLVAVACPSNFVSCSASTVVSPSSYAAVTSDSGGNVVFSPLPVVVSLGSGTVNVQNCGPNSISGSVSAVPPPIYEIYVNGQPSGTYVSGGSPSPACGGPSDSGYVPSWPTTTPVQLNVGVTAGGSGNVYEYVWLRFSNSAVSSSSTSTSSSQSSSSQTSSTASTSTSSSSTSSSSSSSQTSSSSSQTSTSTSTTSTFFVPRSPSSGNLSNVQYGGIGVSALSLLGLVLVNRRAINKGGL